MFTNKVVWITGASSGYGRAMAKEFSKQGANVILSARREAELKLLAQELKSSVVLPLDLAQFDRFEAKTQKAIEAFGHIDIMINNGAIAQHNIHLDDVKDFQKQFFLKPDVHDPKTNIN